MAYLVVIKRLANSDPLVKGIAKKVKAVAKSLLRRIFQNIPGAHVGLCTRPAKKVGRLAILCCISWRGKTLRIKDKGVTVRLVNTICHL